MNVQLAIASQRQADLRAEAARDRLAASFDRPSLLTLLRRIAVRRQTTTRDAVATA